jgi:hypothetical protein
MACNTENDQKCDDITPPPSKTCSGSDLSIVVFSYQNCDCDCGSNGQGDESVCVDQAPLVEDPVTILCVSGAGERMLLEPSTVNPGGSFSVQADNGSTLPQKIDCSISAPDGTKLQQNVIDTSGDVALEIGDKFGAMHLEGCNELQCKVRLVYSIEISNIGDVPMTVDVAQFQFNDNFKNVLDEVGPNPLEPGATSSIEESIEVNVCNGEEHSAKVDIRASPPDGERCDGSREYNFGVQPCPPQSRWRRFLRLWSQY